MKNEQVHFVGIGGIGVSALARWYASDGWRVSGSDCERSEITDELAKEGLHIVIGPHRAKNIPDGAVLIIYSSAAEKNPEVREAHRKKIKIKSYAEALGERARNYFAVTIAGSHGKSTTTAFASLMLTAAGLDPTVVIGTKLREFTSLQRWQEAWLNQGAEMGSNFRSGKSRFLVFEADEWRGAFWNYTPAIAVITNIDREHLDFYKTHEKIKDAFRRFALNIVAGGHLIVNGDDPHARALGEELQKSHQNRFRDKIHFYSLSSVEAALLRPHLFLTGLHNASNAIAAAAIAKTLNIPFDVVTSVLEGFQGSWRRMEPVGSMGGAPVIADYAHHPAEIHATLHAARTRFPGKKMRVVFQPHHYERTKHHFKEFAAAFTEADSVYLLDIYEVAGREKRGRDAAISALHLARAIAENGTDAQYIAYPKMLKEILQEAADKQTVFLMMGAGSIGKMAREISQTVYPFCKMNE